MVAHYRAAVLGNSEQPKIKDKLEPQEKVFYGKCLKSQILSHLRENDLIIWTRNIKADSLSFFPFFVPLIK